MPVASGFGAYVAVSTRYIAVYGALAVVVIRMLAVYVLLLGAVLNIEASRRRSRDG